MLAVYFRLNSLKSCIYFCKILVGIEFVLKPAVAKQYVTILKLLKIKRKITKWLEMRTI